MTGVLDGKVVLVTGASRGLGAEMAVGMAQAGARVVAAARSQDQLAEVVALAPDSITALSLDVTILDECVRVLDQVVASHGRIDVVVNNAGVAPAGDILTQDPEVWRRTFDINVLAPLLIAREAAKQMIAQGGGGKIINIASGAGVRGKAGLVAYSASKAAVIRMTEALAAELAPHNIQVTAIAPGAFRTEAQRAVSDSPDLLARRVRRIPARRMAEAHEIVPLAVLLASDGANFITGTAVVIDGGESGKL
jgi:2-dehydro-3-deoxy-D-gluconate 5-dehydrogenase